MQSLTAGKMNIELLAIAKTQYSKIKPIRCFEVSRCPGVVRSQAGPSCFQERFRVLGSARGKPWRRCLPGTPTGRSPQGCNHFRWLKFCKSTYYRILVMNKTYRIYTLLLLTKSREQLNISTLCRSSGTMESDPKSLTLPHAARPTRRKWGSWSWSRLIDLRAACGRVCRAAFGSNLFHRSV